MNKTIEEIVVFAQKQLTQKYGYCGVATSSDGNFIMINSSDEQGLNLKIVIEIKSEKD